VFFWSKRGNLYNSEPKKKDKVSSATKNQAKNPEEQNLKN
jgi:hypothetical protein